MSKGRSIGIAAGAAAVIIGAGMTAFDNNQDDSQAITIEMNTSSAASDVFSQPELLPDETEEPVSIPEEAAEVILVTVEAEKAAASESEKEPPETTTAATEPPGTAARATAASTAPKTTQTAAATSAEPEEAAVSIPEYNSQTVYIASSGKGSKYHSNPNCSNMKGASAVSIDDARAMGYTACKKCY